MHCANCGVAVGKLEDAHDWLGRPTCQACFASLSARRRGKHRGFWMPLAIGFAAISTGLAVALAAVLARQDAMASDQGAALSDTIVPAFKEVARPPVVVASTLPAVAPVAVPKSPPAKNLVGPTRADIMTMLRADRPWYWHYEQRDKNNPFRFSVDADGGVRTTGEGGKPVMLEQRWVLSLGGHYFIPVDDHTLRGFHLSSGRQAGAFTE